MNAAKEVGVNSRTGPVRSLESRTPTPPVANCVSKQQATDIRDAIATRLSQFGLMLHPEKTKIVYCKQEGRTETHDVPAFTFLGYTFRPRGARIPQGQLMVGFLPAVSKAAMKSMARAIRGWRLGRRTDLTFRDIAKWINHIVAGWINYYGRFYKSQLIGFLRDRINPHLVKCACRKYKHLHRSPAKARKRLAQIANTHKGMFVHWRHGALPDGSTTGAV